MSNVKGPLIRLILTIAHMSPLQAVTVVQGALQHKGFLAYRCLQVGVKVWC